MSCIVGVLTLLLPTNDHWTGPSVASTSAGECYMHSKASSNKSASLQRFDGSRCVWIQIEVRIQRVVEISRIKIDGVDYLVA